jgi:hypothetical protein
MKKEMNKKVKKLQLSRETLRALESSDAQKVLGGQGPISFLPESM